MLVLMLAGCTPAVAVTPAVTAAPTPAASSLSYSGAGADVLEGPADITAGLYRLSWSATANGSGCVFAVAIKDVATGKQVGYPVGEIAADADTNTGSVSETLDGGRYVFDVAASMCSRWSVKLEPVR